MLSQGREKEIAMADDVNKGADFNDDLHLLAGVVGLVSLGRG